MEAWGRGVPLILENAPDASFLEIGGLFITRFARPSAAEAAVEADARTGPNTGTERLKAMQSAMKSEIIFFITITPTGFLFVHEVLTIT